MSTEKVRYRVIVSGDKNMKSKSYGVKAVNATKALNKVEEVAKGHGFNTKDCVLSARLMPAGELDYEILDEENVINT